MKKKILISGVALMLLAGWAGASEDFTTLKGVLADTLTTTEMAAIEGKNKYPYGYCTWYAADRAEASWGLSKKGKELPRWGNAGNWYSSAGNSYKTGSKAKENSIIVFKPGTYESNGKGYSQLGHVAWVNSIDKKRGEIHISEMNFPERGKETSRTISASDKYIRGYIYGPKK